MRLLAVLLVVPVFLFGVYFLDGSLEQFPIAEQQGKVGIVSGVGFIFFALLEAIVMISLCRCSSSARKNRQGLPNHRFKRSARTRSSAKLGR